MNRIPIALALLVVLASGCGSTLSSASEGTTAASAAATDEARIAALEAERLRQDEEIRALRNELAIARGEAETLRNSLASSRVATISIRSGAEGVGDESGRNGQGDLGASWIEPEAGEVVVDEPGPSDSRPRPVLRVRGVPTPAAPTLSIPGVDVPPGFPSGSGMAPLPSMDSVPPAPVPFPAASNSGTPPSFAPVAGPLGATVAPGGAVMVPVAPEPLNTAAQDAAVGTYRMALGHLRDRRYTEAVDAFDLFLRTHASHPYTGNAHYWRAEAIYAQRRYRDALHAFEVFVQRYGSHAKVSDALLKMGLCHARSGDTARARAMFRRVQQEHPDTVAARLASREEAS